MSSVSCVCSFPTNFELLFSRRFLLQLVRLVSMDLAVSRAVIVRTALSVTRRLDNVAVLLAGLALTARTVSLLPRLLSQYSNNNNNNNNNKPTISNAP